MTLKSDIRTAVRGPFEERRCRVCGCTDDDGCEDVCTWVEDDLCSNCAPYIEKSGQGGGQELWYHYSISVPIGSAKEPGPEYVFDVTVSRANLRRAKAKAKQVFDCFIDCRGLKKVPKPGLTDAQVETGINLMHNTMEAAKAEQERIAALNRPASKSHTNSGQKENRLGKL